MEFYPEKIRGKSQVEATLQDLVEHDELNSYSVFELKPVQVREEKVITCKITVDR